MTSPPPPPPPPAGPGRVLNRGDSLGQALNLASLQRHLSLVSAEDLQAIMDPTSLMASTLSETQEREETSTSKAAPAAADKRRVRRDEVAFFFGVVNVGLTAFWVGRSPETYYVYWTIKSALLFTWRFFSYRKKSLQWLMLELCYFGNFLGLYHVWFTPTSIAQRHLAFAFAAGPLMFSIAAMRNSLVFHDVDKSTTLMMHASPAIAAWTLRWYDTVNVSMAPMSLTDSFGELVAKPVALYIVWVVGYYLIVFKLANERIRAEGGVTMFDLMVPKDPNKIKNSPILSFLTSFSPAWQPIVYLAIHGSMASLSFLPVVACWNSFEVHTALLMGLLGLSIWNGGTWYFKVFARKYYVHDEPKKQ